MNIIRQQRAIHWLQKNESLVLPYDTQPGDKPGGQTNVAESEAAWNAYQWNPPQYMPDFEEADDNASPKPTWAKLVEASDKMAIVDDRRYLLINLDHEGERRIIAAYGASSLNDEFKLRLSNRSTPTQDTEAARLRAKHAEIKAWINDSSRTVQELEKYNVTADSLWTV